MVQTTLPLTSWVETFGVLVTVTSDFWPTTFADALSFDESVSFWPRLVSATVLLWLPVVSTVVLKVSVLAFAAPTARFEMVQTPFANVEPDGAETLVTVPRPAGIVSVKTTLVAAL